MTAPERFADSQIPLAPRAPSIHDSTGRTLRFPGRPVPGGARHRRAATAAKWQQWHLYTVLQWVKPAAVTPAVRNRITLDRRNFGLATPRRAALRRRAIPTACPPATSGRTPSPR